MRDKRTPKDVYGNANFEVLDDKNYETPPEDVVHVNGLSMEGCRWDREKRVIGASHGKALYDSQSKSKSNIILSTPLRAFQG